MTATLPDYSDLKALFINCTLKRSPEPSNTQGLVDASAHIMRAHGIGVDIVRAIEAGSLFDFREAAEAMMMSVTEINRATLRALTSASQLD